MKTIQTKPDCTLGFVKHPDFSEVPDDKFIESFTDFMDKEGISPSVEEIVGLRPYKKVIGTLSEITEAQAREFFENVNPNVWKDTGLGKIGSAAKSVGIEEKDFDKYLVIKL